MIVPPVTWSVLSSTSGSARFPHGVPADTYDMTAIASAVPLSPSARSEQVFPTLTPEQIARAAVHGRTRSVQSGEVLIEAGHQ
jgi:hypothetical protein